MNQRGEGSSTAIVAIVVLVLVGLFTFMVFFRGAAGPGKTTVVPVPDKVDINIKPNAQ